MMRRRNGDWKEIGILDEGFGRGKWEQIDEMGTVLLGDPVIHEGEGLRGEDRPGRPDPQTEEVLEPGS